MNLLSREQEVNASLESLKQDRQRLLAQLRELVDHLHGRIEGIESCIEDAAKKTLRTDELYRSIWRPKLVSFRTELEEFSRRCDLRPALCIMGKRGQGKTTLLQNWLGSNRGQSGLEEICLLPTGQIDTTAALVRLTNASGPRSPLNSAFLYVELLNKEHLDGLGVERPPMPTLVSAARRFQLLRKGAQMDAPPEVPFRICRFPTPDDDRWGLNARDGFYEMARRGAEQLTTVQWYTREVTVPIVLNGDAGNAGKLLELLDIVDAPGADASKQGTFREWKQKKNSYVFQLGTREIDVLLICCSAETAAIQIGGQFQNDIWEPWGERCREQATGRVLLAFSHSAVFLTDAENILKAPADSSLNSANKIFKNVLQALMSDSPTGLVIEHELGGLKSETQSHPLVMRE